MNYLLAIDQGTSSTRALLYTSQGQLVAKSQYALTLNYPHPGWVEQCPEEIWTKTVLAINDVVNQVDGRRIIACGITNQRETTLIWDKTTGRCLYPAIVWQDRRTSAYCQSFSRHTDLIRTKTGLLPDPYFSASKLYWLLTTIPEAKLLAQNNQLAFGTIDSFLLWRLTQGRAHLTDATNASRTLLFNIINNQWDDELLELFGIPRSILPTVCASNALFGVIDKTLFGLTIPITAILGDQQAALVGQHCLIPGMTKATFGTGGFLVMNIGTTPVLSQHQLLTTIAYQINNEITYGLEGNIYHAGSVIKWLRDEMKLIKSAAETADLAASLTSNEGVYLVPSFTGLGAPHWLSTVGAVIVGLSCASNRAHVARAALECVAYQTLDILTCMKADSNIDISTLRVDGGMSVNRWLLQFLASQCGLTVQKPADVETTAQGVAMCAALGCNEIASLMQAGNGWQSEIDCYPQENTLWQQQNNRGWLQALQMVSNHQ